MMSRAWTESLKSLFKNQIALEKDQELEKNKAEFERKVTKILKLINEEKGPLCNSIEGSELITLIEDFHGKYQSLYALYDHLSRELRKEVLKLIEITEEELEATTRKKLSSEYLRALSKIQLAWKTIEDLENKAETLVDEWSMLEVENESLKLQLKLTKQRRRIDLEGQFLRLKTQIASKEEELTKTENSLEEVNDGLSQLELLAQQSKFKIFLWVLKWSLLVVENGSLKQQLEFVSQQVLDLNWALEAMQEDNENKIARDCDELEGQIVILSNQIAFKEGELMEIKDSMETMNNVLSQVELERELFQNCISEISEELRRTEKWVSVTNVDVELSSKSLSELVEKVGQLGTGIKEKEEKKLGCEKESKTVRQLFLSIDYQRERCDRLEEMLISKMKNGNH